jgi:hypothetical protein
MPALPLGSSSAAQTLTKPQPSVPSAAQVSPLSQAAIGTGSDTLYFDSQLDSVLHGPVLERGPARLDIDMVKVAGTGTFGSVYKAVIAIGPRNHHDPGPVHIAERAFQRSYEWP